MRTGRPLRFLTVTIAGWTALRVVMLWPDGSAPRAMTKTTPVGEVALAGDDWIPTRLLMRAGMDLPFADAPLLPQPLAATPALVMHPAAAAAPTTAATATAAVRPADPRVVALALAGLVRFGEPRRRDGAQTGAIPPPLRPTLLAPVPARFAGSAWLLTRGGSRGTLLGGQIGGSQAGARITYALGDSRRLALAARVATPLSGRGREAAVGIEWQPTRAPVRLVAEQRVSLDGGRGGPTLMAIGGIGPTPLAAGFRLESYAQVGVIARDGVEAFADGAARVTRPITTVGGATLDLGVGSWGAAQRGAARLDIGPSLGLAVPVGRRSLRLTLDYRERVAGHARPGSGVALSIGSDF